MVSSLPLPPLPLKCRLTNGRNAKFPYYCRAVALELVPAGWCRRRLKGLLAEIDRRPDAGEIRARAAYYCHLEPGQGKLPANAMRICEQRRPKKGEVYYFDSRESLKFFPADFRFQLMPGDGVAETQWSILAKARPLVSCQCPDNSDWTLLKLNKTRHFCFVHDPFSADEKAPGGVFRGKVTDRSWQGPKQKRMQFFKQWHGHPRYDLGDTGRHPVIPEWAGNKMSVWEQLRYRYVFSIEGNDVASNLKWIMSSNSLAVMPTPTYETWFQEGLLQPHVHYVPVAADFSDVEQVLDWYDAHPEARQKILDNAHAWVARFQSPLREFLTSLLTLARYFAATSQPLPNLVPDPFPSPRG